MGHSRLSVLQSNMGPECSELLDHYGWKWWKHQATDLDQVKLEIVDIWHFWSLNDRNRRPVDRTCSE